MQKQLQFPYWDSTKKPDTTLDFDLPKRKKWLNHNSLFEKQDLVNNRPQPIEEDNIDEICLQGLNTYYV